MVEKEGREEEEEWVAKKKHQKVKKSEIETLKKMCSIGWFLCF